MRRRITRGAGGMGAWERMVSLALDLGPYTDAAKTRRRIGMVLTAFLRSPGQKHNPNGTIVSGASGAFSIM